MSIVADIRKTPLNEEHKKLGGKMVDFAGWEMPVQYSSVIEEHNTVREKAGLFDVSHMGQVFVSGNQSLQFLQKLVPQDISLLPDEKAVYTQLTNVDGGIIDDLIIYKISSLKYLLIINASRIEEDVKWLKYNSKDYDVNVDNQSDNLSMIALQGPFSSKIIEKMGISEENQPARFFIKETQLLNFDVLIASTGYTGEDGFEIVVSNEHASELWQNILSYGEEYGIKPIGLAARDTLRLESAYMLYGQDINEDTTPIEASLAWTVSKDKQDYYFGKEKILSQINNSEIKKLIGFKMLDKSIPRHDYIIYINGEEAGLVTSGGVGISINQNIGLGYINAELPSNLGEQIDIMIRGKLHPAEITKRPFYRKK